MDYKFNLAVNNAMKDVNQKNNIGNKKEKSLHLILKYLFEPNSNFHEQKIGRYHADIYNGTIYEIQTRNFYVLNKKLTYYLTEANEKVTIVYPVVVNKWLIWIDETTGETTNKRKSPKQGNEFAILPELYKIKKHLTHQNLTFAIVLIDAEEYRLLNGWSNDKKKGSHREERIPIRLHDIIKLDNLNDFHKLLPENLPEQFAVKDYQKASRLSPKNSGIAINVLHNLNIISFVGKKGRAYLYTKAI